MQRQEEIRKEAKTSVYKGRIPRFLLLLGSLIGLGVIIAGGFFQQGPLQLESFETRGKFFIALFTYLLLSLVSIRANFKCQQITCPAVFSVIFLLAYYSYPPLLLLWGFLLLFVAIYIIAKTMYSYVKEIKD